MSIFDKHKYILNNLIESGNPIIRYNILKLIEGITEKDTSSLMANSDVNYWLQTFDSKEIHGSKDSTFENSIAKLLEFGFDRTHDGFDAIYGKFIEGSYWNTDKTFYSELMATVKYPYLIRAGYFYEPCIHDYFMNRLEVIERTILNRGALIEMSESEKPQKYKDEFVFDIDIREEWLPTIYDLYAFTKIRNHDVDLKRRIEKVVEYIFTDDYQKIPDKAYLYDRIKRRYFAAGSVYHACFREERKLLMIFILSHFKISQSSSYFIEEVDKLLSTKNDDGYFIFDKQLIKEKKNSYYIYNGSPLAKGSCHAPSNRV